jgi:ABC-type multidrug transport system permease subunit
MVMKTLIALSWRELKYLYDFPTIGVLIIIYPFVYVLLGYGLNTMFPQSSFLKFFIPGLLGITSIMYFQLSMSLIRLEKASRMLYVILLHGVTEKLYVLSKIFTYSIISIIRYVIAIITGLFIIGYIPSINALFLMLIALISTDVLWLTTGIIVGNKIRGEGTRDLINTLSQLFLIFFSSAYYIPERLSYIFMIISYANPLTYCINIMRSLYYESISLMEILGLSLMILADIILLFIAIRSLK